MLRVRPGFETIGRYLTFLQEEIFIQKFEVFTIANSTTIVSPFCYFPFLVALLSGCLQLQIPLPLFPLSVIFYLMLQFYRIFTLTLTGRNTDEYY